MPRSRENCRFRQSTLSADPPGQRVIVDGSAITAPQSFDWAPGSKHTVDVADPRSLPGATTPRYLFGRWSDNQPRSHTTTTSSDITVFIASFSGMQVNARIPLDAPSGNVPIAVFVGDQASPDWVTIAVR